MLGGDGCLIDGGAGDDDIETSGPNNTVYGGMGDDIITGLNLYEDALRMSTQVMEMTLYSLYTENTKLLETTAMTLLISLKAQQCSLINSRLTQ